MSDHHSSDRYSSDPSSSDPHSSFHRRPVEGAGDHTQPLEQITAMAARRESERAQAERDRGREPWAGFGAAQPAAVPAASGRRGVWRGLAIGGVAAVALAIAVPAIASSTLDPGATTVSLSSAPAADGASSPTGSATGQAAPPATAEGGAATAPAAPGGTGGPACGPKPGPRGKAGAPAPGAGDATRAKPTPPTASQGRTRPAPADHKDRPAPATPPATGGETQAPQGS